MTQSVCSAAGFFFGGEQHLQSAVPLRPQYRRSCRYVTTNQGGRFHWWFPQRLSAQRGGCLCCWRLAPAAAQTPTPRAVNRRAVGIHRVWGVRAASRRHLTGRERCRASPWVAPTPAVHSWWTDLGSNRISPVLRSTTVKPRSTRPRIMRIWTESEGIHSEKPRSLDNSGSSHRSICLADRIRHLSPAALASARRQLRTMRRSRNHPPSPSWLCNPKTRGSANGHSPE